MSVLPLIFGEVLFDHFPDGETVLGGAPFNVAWHLQAFGARPTTITRIGDDAQGQRIVDAMQTWGMDDSGVQHDAARETGRVDVDLSQGEPRYDIRTGVAFDAIAAEALPPLETASLLYHGTLALRSETCRAALDTLKRFCGAPTFLDVNLRSPWWDKAQVLDLVSRARWVKLNAEELDLLAGPDGDIVSRARRWIEDWGLSLVIVTQGAKGALAVEASGAITQPPPPRAEVVVDPVGAGDAFAATVILGLLHGWSLDTTLCRAQDFAAAVVGRRGAISADPRHYRGFANAWDLAVAAP